MIGSIFMILFFGFLFYFFNSGRPWENQRREYAKGVELLKGHEASCQQFLRSSTTGAQERHNRPLTRSRSMACCWDHSWTVVPPFGFLLLELFFETIGDWPELQLNPSGQWAGHEPWLVWSPCQQCTAMAMMVTSSCNSLQPMATDVFPSAIGWWLMRHWGAGQALTKEKNH